MAKRHEKTNHAYNSCAINISGNITGFSYAYYKQTKIQTNFIKKTKKNVNKVEDNADL